MTWLPDSRSALFCGVLLALLSALPMLNLQAAELEFIVFAGAPKTLSASLEIAQTGFPDLDLSPGFRSEPFMSPVYYAVRMGLKHRRGTWALDFIHHKLILDDTVTEVQAFSITHGYNILSMLYLRDIGAWSLSAGAGVVVAHPENEVRGRILAESGGIGGNGYHLTGPAGQLGVGRRVAIRRAVFLIVEARFVFSRAKVPIDRGEATVVETSVHGLAGLGFSF